MDFELVSGTRFEDQNGVRTAYPVLRVLFEGVPLAVFEKENLEAQAAEYIRTHGYLARWTKSWNQGKPTDWHGEH